MEKLGFSKNYIEFIEILYKENKSVILNNGFLSETISLFRGLRQGCPLSLPLYVVQGEVTTENINKNDKIKGMKIPNLKKHKIQFETIKILGICFNEDLHYANNINWENTLEKMENT